jgi:hypothetical protein
MQRRNDCALRERKPPFPIGLDRYIVAQLGAQIVGLRFLVVVLGLDLLLLLDRWPVLLNWGGRGH